MIRLTRLADEPVLTPDPSRPWERAAVFNPAVVYENGLFHLLYRACDRPFRLDTPVPRHRFTSVIGHATSRDGIHFQRDPQPVLTGRGAQEAWGVEDPRVTRLGSEYVMLYTAFGGRSWDDVRIAMARSRDLVHWEDRRIVLDEPNKNAALFPERVGGRYVLLHRRHPDIWIAWSEDLRGWTDHRVLMRPREGAWDCRKIGAAGPPMRIPEGWLLFYHGVDERGTYRLGVALLDPDDPSRVLARQAEPVLEPEREWERRGLVPGVVFSCGAAEVGDAYYVYYGAADTVIGVAVLPKGDVRF